MNEMRAEVMGPHNQSTLIKAKTTPDLVRVGTAPKTQAKK